MLDQFYVKSIEEVRNDTSMDIRNTDIMSNDTRLLLYDEENLNQLMFVPEGIADEVFAEARYEHITCYSCEDGEITKQGWQVPRSVAEQYKDQIIAKSDSVALSKGGTLTSIVGEVYRKDDPEAEYNDNSN